MPVKNENPDKWTRDTNSTDSPRSYLNYALNRLINQQAVAEGADLMPPVIRGLRVLPPSGLRVVRQEDLKFASRFILQWVPDQSMELLGARYRIYAYAQQNVMPIQTTQSVNTPGWTGPPLAKVMADASPAEVIIPGYQRQPVTFSIETRLPNGFVALEDVRPTCTGVCNPLFNSVRAVTAAYTAIMGDETILADATGGSFAVNLFDCRQLPPGFTYTLKKLNAGNTVTWTPFIAAQTIDGAASIASTTQYEFFNIRTDGAVWHKV